LAIWRWWYNIALVVFDLRLDDFLGLPWLADSEGLGSYTLFLVATSPIVLQTIAAVLAVLAARFERVDSCFGRCNCKVPFPIVPILCNFTIAGMVKLPHVRVK
jgi:hypothetical protein